MKTTPPRFRRATTLTAKFVTFKGGFDRVLPLARAIEALTFWRRAANPRAVQFARHQARESQRFGLAATGNAELFHPSMNGGDVYSKFIGNRLHRPGRIILAAQPIGVPSSPTVMSHNEDVPAVLARIPERCSATATSAERGGTFRKAGTGLAALPVGVRFGSVTGRNAGACQMVIEGIRREAVSGGNGRCSRLWALGTSYGVNIIAVLGAKCEYFGIATRLGAGPDMATKRNCSGIAYKRWGIR